MEIQKRIQDDDTGLGVDRLELRHDDFQRLCVTYGTDVYVGVKAVRAFPLSAPGSHVFLLDGEDQEIGMIADIAALERSSRKALEQELDSEYFAIRVTAIDSVKSRHGVTTWDFQTDRGARTVHVKDRGDIRRLPGAHVLFTDIYGMKYEIQNLAELDERSRACLDAET